MSSLNRKFLVLVLLACGTPAVNSDEQARRAYLGLDKAIGKCLTLGFDGFNAATSANIDPQSTSGDKSGTVTVTGQVDKGVSANKGMRLNVAMNNYSDGDIHPDGGPTLMVTYQTNDGGTLPTLDLTLRNVPTGTLDGTLAGDFAMSGDLTGVVTLNLTMSGMLEACCDGGTERKPGTTTVTGTAKSGSGTFNVDLTL